MREGLALIYTDHCIVYLGFKTHLGLPSTSLGTPASRVGQGGVLIPSRVLLHVSIYLDTSGMYFNDQNEGNQGHVGSFRANSDPLLKGSDRKICNCATTQRAVVSPFVGHIKGSIYDGIRPLLRCCTAPSCLGRNRRTRAKIRNRSPTR